MILGWLECLFHSRAHASNISSVGPPNSTKRNGPDNRGEDATSGPYFIKVKIFLKSGFKKNWSSLSLGECLSFSSS